MEFAVLILTCFKDFGFTGFTLIQKLYSWISRQVLKNYKLLGIFNLTPICIFSLKNQKPVKFIWNLLIVKSKITFKTVVSKRKN